jgi:outer membrane protein OmpA-like peptidoglycan-associated protein
MKEIFNKATFVSKVLMLGVLFAIGYGVKWLIVDSGVIPKSVKQSSVIVVNDLPPLAYDKTANAPLADLPTKQESDQVGGEIRAGIMGWNAQSGVLYANGGVTTTKGSFMEQQNVKLRLITQNNCTEQGNQLYAFIEDYSKGNFNTTKGYHMIAWMGDGVPGLLTGLNETIKKNLGEEFQVKVFYAGGASFGEDKFMGRPSAKRDPQSLRGSLVVGVILDGDWNIAMKYCSDNQIPVNNDPTTYDPNAVNWMGVDDYLKAAEIYISGAKEKRPVVIGNKRTGRDTTVTVDGLVTWTPGDVNAATKKGGLVTLASTKDYGAQMPNAWLASNKWLTDNRKKVEGFILAAALGGDQVKSHSRALTYAASVAAELYGDLTAEEWEKYFKGYSFTDVQGNIVELGGSRVFNLADNATYFGLSGGVNKYEAVYTTFGDIAVQSYPERLPSYKPVSEVLDLSYLTAVYSRNKSNAQMTGASEPTFKKGETMSTLVSSKAVTIEFELGSAVISSVSNNTLLHITRDLVVAENLLVTIDGHTDNTGNPDLNLTLSQQRAEAVKQWLVSKNQNFANKITTNGYGQEKPIASNATAAGRAKNRRVEIKLGR